VLVNHKSLEFCVGLSAFSFQLLLSSARALLLLCGSEMRPDELLILIAFIDQRLGAREREHAAACTARMKVVGQSCFDPGALVCDRERVTPLWIDV